MNFYRMPRLSLPFLPSPVRWGLVAAVATVIFANSIVLATPAPPEPGPFWDKKLHFVAYATLTASLAYATARSNLKPNTRLLAVLLIAVAYGVTIELLQAPLPERYFSFADMIANAIGAVLGLGYLLIETRIRYVSLNRWS